MAIKSLPGIDHNYKPRILVIGNYLPDQQESMIRYASLLSWIYSRVGKVSLNTPPCLAGRLPFLPRVIRKYINYIDKFILFPFWLFFSSRSFDLVHIADHSNAFYSFFSPRGRSVITCHDLLAVRGAFGDQAAACDASPFGIWLQRLIMAGLRDADAVVFPSNSSFQDFQQLILSPSRQRHAVIPNPLNGLFTSDHTVFPITATEKSLMPVQPYLLMVGSSLPRKNRRLALQLLERLGPNSPYCVVFAGDPLTSDESAFSANHFLGSRLMSIVRPNHAFLNFLYCHAHALLFPSYSEGFGWPVVEAQICSCPVITSNTTSMPEVAGEGALYADPSDVATFMRHVLALEDPSHRSRLVNLGLANTRRFTPEAIADEYTRFAFQL